MPDKQIFMGCDKGGPYFFFCQFGANIDLIDIGKFWFIKDKSEGDIVGGFL